jgi:hypothetical protein
VTNGCGGHAFAKHPEGPWYDSLEPAYTTAVEFDDGSIEHMSRRERPQLLLSDGNHGAPLFLSNGVMSGGAQGDSVHTLVQKVA